MELLSDEDFIKKWLAKKHFQESTVNEMLSSQLNYFSNRRQIDKFHVWLLNCSRQVDLSFQIVYLPKGFKCLYGDKIIKAPPLQTIQTWKHFLEEDIVNSPLVLELFICFLNHLRVCDDLTPKMVIPQENLCIQATREQILNLPFTELKSHNQLALILRLANAWGNLVLLKNFYENESLNTQLTKYSWYDLNPVHDYYDASVWKAIANECLSSEGELVEIIFLLMIQKLSFLTKSMYTESDLNVRENCSESIKTTVDVILTKFLAKPDLLNSLDLWKFSTFVPDGHIDKLTQVIVDGIVLCDDEIPFQLSSTINKGCERSTFVISMIESIIRKFIDDLREGLPLSQLFVYLEKEQFFKESTEMIDLKVAKKLSKLIQNALCRDKNVSDSLPAFRTLQILKFIPLEHLQDEAQLKCSILLISLAFTMGFTSNSAQIIIDLALLILKSDQILWFFKAYDSTEFFNILITRVHQQKNVPRYLADFIETIIGRLFQDYPSSEIINTIQNVSDKVTASKSLCTSRCISTLILKSLTMIDCSETELATQLISHLLEVLRDSSSLIELTQTDINESLLALMGFFSKRTKLSGKEQKLLKKFTSVCSKSIDDVCKSLFNSNNVDEDNFKSNIKFLVFLCSTSQSSDLLSVDRLSLIWSSLFPNYPSIDEADNPSINDQNNEETFSAIPVISKCIFANSTAHNLSDYVEYCFKMLDSGSDENTKLLVVHVLKGLITKEWTKSSAKDSRMYQFTDSIMDGLLHAITSTVKDQTFNSNSININLIQSCGDLTKSILHLGKDLLTSPRLYYCLLVCTFLPLRQLVSYPDKYSKVAATHHSILSQFLINYNFMVTSSMVLIKELIQNYLTTLVQISDQSSFTNLDKSVQKDLVNSASDLNKLISQLTNDFASDFATFSPHLISCYIHLNHSYTVHPLIKKHLTLCMYRLLNVIKSNPKWKDTYDMIHCRLDESGRDLLKILYENYEKFYVLKGRF